MNKIVNLTPHAIAVLVEDANGSVEGSVGFGRAARPGTFRLVAELPSEGVARATTSSVPAGSVEVNGVSIPVTKTVFGEVADLPEPANGVQLVVSMVTANAAAACGRSTDDLLIVGETVRDGGGNIIGTTGFGIVV
jgi:hypothetical protein